MATEDDDAHEMLPSKPLSKAARRRAREKTAALAQDDRHGHMLENHGGAAHHAFLRDFVFFDD